MLFVVFSLLVIVVAAYAETRRPEIVGEILPVVKRKGQTARLSCTVINTEGSNTQVVWSHTESGDFISSNKVIGIFNPEIDHQGTFKYDVKETTNGDRHTYTLNIANLGERDAGEYVCSIHQVNVAVEDWPEKKGKITVLDDSNRR